MVCAEVARGSAVNTQMNMTNNNDNNNTKTDNPPQTVSSNAVWGQGGHPTKLVLTSLPVQLHRASISSIAEEQQVK